MTEILGEDNRLEADKTLSKGCEILLSDSYHIWYKLDKNFFRLQENLVICNLYIPPHDNNWFQSGKSFNYDKLKEESILFQKFEGVAIDFARF